MNEQGFYKALSNFVNSEDLVDAIIKSTKAGFGGSSYTVELLSDGGYRVLYTGNIGNLYKSPGVLLQVPGLTDREVAGVDDDWTLQDAADLAADDIAEEIEAKLDDALEFGGAV